MSVTGEVIGVNSAIESETGFYSGYGFAIPINLAKRVMDQIIAHGRVERAALGVTVRDATPNDAAYVGLPDVRGIVVQDYGTENSPAKAAGIAPETSSSPSTGSRSSTSDSCSNRSPSGTRERR